MLCYKDKTFCPYYYKCVYGSNCNRALTAQVQERAIASRLSLSIFGDVPGCFSPVSEDIDIND